ncbi:hypothetical protein L226DRAFT_545112 [Lentinus tigrinus ALCF2SS1-7]|uniref:UbiA prenyltransferase n=1 Tax=Lentinus tigrinus ALCF2SS1-6 TaxID=1328759 RepID=A0A5C2SA96_9APHY|nr:hypothetical protein L227DRAFT_611138 [Lentinus tigrinus ALCF2SS1-6]RPD75854.1 hypothetical protein L226DRAFT_545112 [Lentinus tigrinus ALCF2SS1-7]
MTVHIRNTRLSSSPYHAYTLYLFTKSDMKTILFPITLFAWCTVPHRAIAAFAKAFIWTWLYLLQFCVSNQSLSPGEDLINKPWRPIPAGRVSIGNARLLRWILLPLCLLFSYTSGVFPVGVILALGIFLHNEMRLDSHWFTRNVLNAIGYAVFDAGATSITQSGSLSQLSPRALLAHYMSIFIVLTTIHAQDFQDEAGDRLEKRRTIPIVMPNGGRTSMLVALPVWSVSLCTLFPLPVWLRAVMLALGVWVGLRFYLLRDPAADKRSYLLYNVWLAIARIAPTIDSELP